MATKKMMQGDSYSLPFTITMNGTTEITPDLIAELELCVGDENGVSIRKTFSSESVQYDYTERKWFFRLTQQETLNLEPRGYDVVVRIKLSNSDDADVIGIPIGRIIITDGQSEEVI